MIRDPSDGSVREPAKPMVSGMPEPVQHTKDDLERLNKSREWLRNYQAMRASNGTEKINMPTSEAAE